MGVFLGLLWVFSVLSLLAVGGANAVLPEMHRQLVEMRGWLDDATFSQLYALAQAAPGPNILVASLMGYWIGAVPGLIAATLGMLVPSGAIAWMVGGLTQRLAGHPWLKAVQTGLVPIAIGLILAAGLTMAEASSGGHFDGPGIVWLAVSLVSTVFVWRTDFSPLWVLAGGGVLGLVLAS
ncbi:MAG TPA: chromate transporter [Roseomonas sp.]|jgi:chromate transporter